MEGATTVTHNSDRLEKVEQAFSEVEQGRRSAWESAAASLAGKLQFLDPNTYG